MEELWGLLQREDARDAVRERPLRMLKQTRVASAFLGIEALPSL